MHDHSEQVYYGETSNQPVPTNNWVSKELANSGIRTTTRIGCPSISCFSCFCCIGLLLLFIGAILMGMKDNNYEAGKILVIIGGSMVGLSLLTSCISCFIFFFICFLVVFIFTGAAGFLLWDARNSRPNLSNIDDSFEIKEDDQGL
jgi:hypothetical protein